MTRIRRCFVCMCRFATIARHLHRLRDPNAKSQGNCKIFRHSGLGFRVFRNYIILRQNYLNLRQIYLNLRQIYIILSFSGLGFRVFKNYFFGFWVFKNYFFGFWGFKNYFFGFWVFKNFGLVFWLSKNFGLVFWLSKIFFVDQNSPIFFLIGNSSFSLMFRTDVRVRNGRVPKYPKVTERYPSNPKYTRFRAHISNTLCLR